MSKTLGSKHTHGKKHVKNGSRESPIRDRSLAILKPLGNLTAQDFWTEWDRLSRGRGQENLPSTEQSSTPASNGAGSTEPPK